MCDVSVQSAVNGKKIHLHKKYYQKIAKIDKILLCIKKIRVTEMYIQCKYESIGVRSVFVRLHNYMIT